MYLTWLRQKHSPNVTLTYNLPTFLKKKNLIGGRSGDLFQILRAQSKRTRPTKSNNGRYSPSRCLSTAHGLSAFAKTENKCFFFFFCWRGLAQMFQVQSAPLYRVLIMFIVRNGTNINLFFVHRVIWSRHSWACGSILHLNQGF